MFGSLRNNIGIARNSTGSYLHERQTKNNAKHVTHFKQWYVSLQCVRKHFQNMQIN